MQTVNKHIVTDTIIYQVERSMKIWRAFDWHYSSYFALRETYFLNAEMMGVFLAAL